MTEPTPQEFLEAKRTVDAGSFHAATRRRFRRLLESHRTFRLVDVGTGTGAMLRELATLRLKGRFEFVGLDCDAVSLTMAREKCREDLLARDYQVVTSRSKLVATNTDAQLSFRFVKGDFLEGPQTVAKRYAANFVTAHTVFDLFPLGSTVEGLKRWLPNGGHVYSTMNYDGQTVWLPIYEDEGFEDKLLARYDLSMEERRVDGKPIGGARCGRRLLSRMMSAGFEIESCGSSDWEVFPQGGRLSLAKTTFLRGMLGFAVKEGRSDTKIGQRKLDAWRVHRLDQLAIGGLALMSHQLDILARVRAANG